MKALEIVRRFGALDAALLVAARALAHVPTHRARLCKYYFLAQPVPDDPIRVARASGIVVEELLKGDARLDQLGRADDELARRFAASARCFAAWQGEQLTGFLWFTDREYQEDEVRCTFRVDPRDRAVWDLDVHVVPRYRLGRTFALLWERAFAAMRARGVRWTISRVSAFNADSIRAHQRLGARPTGWAVFLSLGSIQVTLTSLGELKCRAGSHSSAARRAEWRCRTPRSARRRRRRTRGLLVVSARATPPHAEGCWSFEAGRAGCFVAIVTAL